jgi:hypothetical protein
MWNLFKRKRKPSLTKIEDALFRGQNRTHAITEFAISSDSITIRLAPWIDPGIPDSNALVKATFKKAVIKSKEILGDAIEYPWDIVGFDSEPVLNNRWDFYLCTDCIAYGFESDWPEIK